MGKKYVQQSRFSVVQLEILQYRRVAKQVQKRLRITPEEKSRLQRVGFVCALIHFTLKIFLILFLDDTTQRQNRKLKVGSNDLERQYLFRDLGKPIFFFFMNDGRHKGIG
jgi:hypothetical protein